MARIRHWKQNLPRNCGQTCVAMVSGESPYHVMFKVMNKFSGTHGTDLMKALYKLGILYYKVQLVRKGKKLPKKAILRLKPIDKNNKWGGHWVVKSGNRIFDPALEGPVKLEVYEQTSLVAQNAKFTSYIEILG